MSNTPRADSLSEQKYDDFSWADEQQAEMEKRLGMTNTAAAIRKTRTAVPLSMEEEHRYATMLVNGRTFVKYGRRGKPHCVFVCLSRDMLRVRWGVEPKMKTPSASKFELVKDLWTVCSGCDTVVFRRFTKCQEESCFSLVFNNQRTIDLELPVDSATMERDLWVKAFKWLISQRGARNTSSPSTRIGLNTSYYDSLSIEDLNEMFVAFMEVRCFNKHARDTMMAMSRLKKGQLLAQAEFVVSKNDAHVWISQLEPHIVTPQILRDLRVVIAGQGKKWLTKFMGQVEGELLSNLPDGISSLFGLLRLQEDLPGCALEALQCLFALMNNEFVLSMILGRANSFSAIVQVLNSGDEAMQILALEVMILVCWVSFEVGHQVVLDAFAATACTKRFKVLVDMCCLEANSLVLKLQTMTFINILITTCDDFDLRLATREPFLDHGMVTHVLPSLQAAIDHSSGVCFVERRTQLQWQCDFFLSQWTADVEDLGINYHPDAGG